MSWISWNQALPSAPIYSVWPTPRWHHETAVVDVSKTSNTEQQSITTESVAIWRGLFWATFFQGVVACAAALVWKLGTSGL